MATYIPLLPVPVQFQDTNGDNLASGTLEFYLSGTATPTNLFSDSSGTSIGTSITLNADGYPESGGNVITLFRDPAVSLKIIAKDSSAVEQWTADELVAFPWLSVNTSSELQIDVTAVDINATVDISGSTTFGGVGSSSANTILLSSTLPLIRLTATGAPTDEKSYQIFANSSGQLSFRTTNEANDSTENFFVIDRTAEVVDQIQMNATTIDINGFIDNNKNIALGGGASATLGTIGGSGPTSAGQAQWWEIKIGGTSHWIPVWT